MPVDGGVPGRPDEVQALRVRYLFIDLYECELCVLEGASAPHRSVPERNRGSIIASLKPDEKPRMSCCSSKQRNTSCHRTIGSDGKWESQNSFPFDVSMRKKREITRSWRRVFCSYSFSWRCLFSYHCYQLISTKVAKEWSVVWCGVGKSG